MTCTSLSPEIYPIPPRIPLSDQKEIKDLIKSDPLFPIPSRGKKLLWKYREYIKNDPKVIIQSFDFYSSFSASKFWCIHSYFLILCFSIRRLCQSFYFQFHVLIVMLFKKCIIFLTNGQKFNLLMLSRFLHNFINIKLFSLWNDWWWSFFLLIDVFF